MSDNDQIEAESDTGATKAQLKRLKLSQPGHRSSVTRFVDEAKQVIADGDRQHKSVDRLEQLAGNIRHKMQDLQTLHAKILDLVDEEEMERQIEEADKVADRLWVVLIRADKLVIDARQSTGPSVVRYATQELSQARKDAIKMPKLDYLPSLSGSYTEWTSFWDLFNTSIHAIAILSSWVISKLLLLVNWADLLQHKSGTPTTQLREKYELAGMITSGQFFVHI